MRFVFHVFFFINFINKILSFSFNWLGLLLFLLVWQGLRVFVCVLAPICAVDALIYIVVEFVLNQRVYQNIRGNMAYRLFLWMCPEWKKANKLFESNLFSSNLIKIILIGSLLCLVASNKMRIQNVQDEIYGTWL